MKKFLLLFSITMLSACVHSPKQTELTELEDDKYQISVISEEHWSADFLTAELLKSAEEYCQRQNRQFERLSITKEDERRFNYSSSTVIFRCIVR